METEENILAAEASSEEEDFVKHLEEASRVVGSWPDWKRSVLGWRPNTAAPPEENGVKRECANCNQPETKQ